MRLFRAMHTRQQFMRYTTGRIAPPRAILGRPRTLGPPPLIFVYVRTLRRAVMHNAVLDVVLTCLAEKVPTCQAYARIVEAARAKGGLAVLQAELTDVLVTMAFASKPMPPLLLDYLDALCMKCAYDTDVTAFEEGRVLLVLLRKLPDAAQDVDQATVNMLSQLVLQAAGDPTMSDTVSLSYFIEGFDNDFLAFWRATLHLVRDADGAGARLFTRLVAQAARDGWPTLDESPALENIQEEIQQLAASVDAMHTNRPTSDGDATRHAVATLQRGLSSTMVDDLFDETNVSVSSPIQPLWGTRAYLAYATSLHVAWQQSQGAQTRRPVLPVPCSPEPEMFLLAHTLANGDMDWTQKCLAVQGVFQAHLHHAVRIPSYSNHRRNRPPIYVVPSYWSSLLHAFTQRWKPCIMKHPDETLVGGVQLSVDWYVLPSLPLSFPRFLYSLWPMCLLRMKAH